AEDGRGQTGKDRQRMNEALIQNSQHDVDDENRDDQKQREVLYGVLKLARRTLERAADRFRQASRDIADLSDGFAESDARLDGEGDRNRRQLAHMMNGQRTGVLREFRDRFERDELPIVGLHVDQR